MALARAETTGGAILYDPSRIELPTDADFDPERLVAAGRVHGHATGRGQALFLASRPARADGTQWVLRHYRRGGLIARLSPDRYLWTGEAATRCFAEAALLDYLAGRGMPVPVPVAARYVRTGLVYRADLLTVAIPGVRTLAALCVAEPLSRDLAAGVGAAVRRLHAEGVWHADLNAHNVLVDRDGRIWIIDFDRARLRPAGSWAAANLARLHRSLDKVCAAAGQEFPGASWAAVEAGYVGS